MFVDDHRNENSDASASWLSKGVCCTQQILGALVRYVQDLAAHMQLQAFSRCSTPESGQIDIIWRSLSPYGPLYLGLINGNSCRISLVK